jgi:uncharacterized protein YggU (UPF0235/DUF167 family)
LRQDQKHGYADRPRQGPANRVLVANLRKPRSWAQYAQRCAIPRTSIKRSKRPAGPKVESDEIVEAVKKNGGIVEYILFPDEGHGFSKKVNEIRANKAILAFLDRHLKKARVSR